VTTSERIRNGLKWAINKTGITSRQASLKAGFNENQLHRYLTERNDILVGNLEKICVDGFGLTFNEIYELGGKTEG